MPEPASGTADTLPATLKRIVRVERQEVPALLWSFAFFFCVLAGYYVIRPVREEMGVRIGRDWLQTLFVAVFFVMLAAVPLFGWVVSRFEKRRIVPLVYGFFIACLGGFSLLMNLTEVSVPAAATFFIWVSIFNLFAVSLFWSVMAGSPC